MNSDDEARDDEDIDGYIPPPPYMFDPNGVEAAAHLLDDIHRDRVIDGWQCWELMESVRATATGSVSEACAHEVGRLAARPLQLDPADASCKLQAERKHSLEAIRDASDATVDLWSAMAAIVATPGAIARLEDLLFIRKIGNGGVRARRAIRGYLDAVGNQENSRSVTTHVLRAWTLARAIKAVELENVVLDEIERRVDDLMSSELPRQPTSLLPLVRAMIRKPGDLARTQTLRAHAEAVLNQLGAGDTRPHLATQVADLRRQLINASYAGNSPSLSHELQLIARDELAAYLRAVDEDTSLPAVALHRLEAAGRLAHRHGLAAEEREIVSRMQQIGRSDIGLQSVTTSRAIPPWIPESYLDDYTRGDDWRTGLYAFMTSPPPSGDIASLRSFAQQSRGGLSQLFSTKLLGPDNMPRATLGSQEKNDRHQMALMSRITAETHGQLLAIGLRRLHEHHGDISEDDLADFFLEWGARDPIAVHSLSKAFRYFWIGDTEAAAAIALPRIEAAARELLLELDAGIYRLETARDPGQYPGLRFLLDALDALCLDESWSWYLRWLLLGPIGANLRNDIAHGIITDPGPVNAALILRGASILVTAAAQTDDDGQKIVIARNHMRTRRGQIFRWGANRLARATLQLHLALVNRADTAP